MSCSTDKTDMPFTSYLIVGGFGSVGSAVVAKLFETTQAKVVVLDALNGYDTQLSPAILNSERFVPIIGSSVNETLFEKTLRDEKIECVIDCASKASTPYSNAENPIAQARNATEGLTHMMDAIRAYGALKSFVLISSQKVYGIASAQKEDDPIYPVCFDGAALMSAEAMLHSYVISYRLPMAIARVSIGIVGEKGLQTVIDSMNEESTYINVISSNDVASAILLVADKAKDAEVYNVGGDKDYSKEELEKALAGQEVTGKPSGLHMEKIQGLGFKPQFDVLNQPPTAPSTASSSVSPKILLFGAKGWIGQQFMELLKDKEIVSVTANSRPGSDPDAEVLDEIVRVAPSHVISMIGRTHGPGVNSIAFLEGGPDKIRLNMRDNLYAPWLLASICEKNGIHFTYLGTGCLFKYDDEHPIGGKGYTEDDVGNYDGNSYSAVKAFTDRLLRQFTRTLQCRIRLPINYEKDPRNLVSKLMHFNKVLDIPNSVTVLPDCLPILLDMTLKRQTGIINLVNPDPITFPDVLSLYKQLLKPEAEWEVLSGDAASDLVNTRSHSTLSTDKLQSLYPNIRPAREGIIEAINKIGSHN